MGIKAKVTEAVERIYDLTKEGKYDVRVDLLPGKKATAKSKGVTVVSSRNTNHNKKWRAKIG